jgi:hypothetical protein
MYYTQNPYIRIAEVEGGMHGGMMFRSVAHALVHNGDRQNPRLLQRTISRPTREELVTELCHRYRNGWREIDGDFNVLMQHEYCPRPRRRNGRLRNPAYNR